MAGEGLVARGFELNPDDSVRGYAIERLLCDFELDLVDLRARFGEGADAVIDDAVGMAMNDRFDLVRMVPGKLVVTEIGRPYVRTVAAGLDAYLDVGGARYSKAV
jgi:oxygen-independent coproporphyrinogen-3 oxidase